MTAYLCIAIRFADPTFRGRSHGGGPEWPPSPLRLFQALVAAAAARFGNPDQFRAYAIPAFEWLAGLPPPTILAPKSVTGIPFRTAVPNNDLDVVAKDWARRVEPGKQPAELKTLKTVQPTHLVGSGEFPAVHYLWGIPSADQAGCERHREVLFAAARGLVALGWGTDMAVGWGGMLSPADIRELKGERWEPAGEPATTELRVPVPGTFDALVSRYAEFLSRIGEKGFVPVPPLSAFAVVGYRRPTDTASPPFAAFAILRPDTSGFRAFDTVRKAAAVALMVRHAVARAARQAGWEDERINTFVHGHTPDGNDYVRGNATSRRFSYLPLPTINHLKVENIRRVLVVGPPGGERQIEWIRRALAGQPLLAEHGNEPVGLLSVIPITDRTVQPYTREASVWSTVTPLVLPGHDDTGGLRHRLSNTRDSERQRRLLERLDRRTLALLQKAFMQAGVAPELVEAAELEWRETGFRPGTDLARHYVLPQPNTTLPKSHVRVRWPVPIRGPLVAGVLRYRGLGVFAAEDSRKGTA